MEKTTFAYIDRGHILHMTENLDTATQFALKGSTVVPTEIEAHGGYPVVGSEEIIVYSEVEMKLSAQGAPIPVIPKLAELYRRCK